MTPIYSATGAKVAKGRTCQYQKHLATLVANRDTEALGVMMMEHMDTITRDNDEDYEILLPTHIPVHFLRLHPSLRSLQVEAESSNNSVQIH